MVPDVQKTSGLHGTTQDLDGLGGGGEVWRTLSHERQCRQEFLASQALIACASISCEFHAAAPHEKLAWMNMATVIKTRRGELGLSMPSLAHAVDDLMQAAGINIKSPTSRQMVQHWERGANYPTTDKIPFVAKALKVTVGELFGESPTSKLSNKQAGDGKIPHFGEAGTGALEWPFLTIKRAEIESLDPRQLARLEKTMRDRINELLEDAADAGNDEEPSIAPPNRTRSSHG